MDKQMDKRFDSLTASMLMNSVIGRVNKCKDCPLHSSRLQAVPGDGSASADVFFLGEAPGKHEDEKGVPFIGRAGMLFARLLSGIGLRRENVFVTNTLKCRPPANNYEEARKMLAVERCRHYTEEQLFICQPKIVVCVGRHAMEWFGWVGSIGSNHGMVKELDGKDFALMAVYHPAATLYGKGITMDTLRADFAGLSTFLKDMTPGYMGEEMTLEQYEEYRRSLGIKSPSEEVKQWITQKKN